MEGEDDENQALSSGHLCNVGVQTDDFALGASGSSICQSPEYDDIERMYREIDADGLSKS